MYGGYFKGKTVLITGAASGVGRATAKLFGDNGANVVGLDVNERALSTLAADLSLDDDQVLALTADVTERASVDSAVAAGVQRFGSIDFLFNSAGAAFRREAFLDIDDELIEKTFALNVFGTFYTMQAVLPSMVERRSGVIVNVASMAFKRGGPGSSIHYAAAKGAVNSMTLGVGREFASQGVRCLSVSPTSINTPFQSAASSGSEFAERFLRDIPMGRFAEPEEIGELVLFLCSDKCQFMTADTVFVSGGSGYR